MSLEGSKIKTTREITQNNHTIDKGYEGVIKNVWTTATTSVEVPTGTTHEEPLGGGATETVRDTVSRELPPNVKYDVNFTVYNGNVWEFVGLSQGDIELV
ncbi:MULTISPECIES: hypothetical protein [unclassified Streptomyces]|uniref:hypothetical protein n=1 Tax=unclassified Streptomyces TaxID=2593676 RepID=UPI002DD9F344|nr:hypothetical protein [Streptomyces sp. NBC_01237]WRZ72116.1 hypothetical protein OG251_11040 [Streptomyces sp. NBC_01237]